MCSKSRVSFFSTDWCEGEHLGISHLPEVFPLSPNLLGNPSFSCTNDLTMTALVGPQLGTATPRRVLRKCQVVSSGEAQHSEWSLSASRENGIVWVLWEVKLSTYGCFQSYGANTIGRQQTQQKAWQSGARKNGEHWSYQNAPTGQDV